jgi:hypothetical protein
VPFTKKKNLIPSVAIGILAIVEAWVFDGYIDLFAGNP